MEALEPRFHFRMLVSRIVVNDQMQVETGGSLLVDQPEELDELLMAMPRHTCADQLAFRHVQRRKQRGCAVSLVVVRHGSAAPLLERQPRLRAVQRLVTVHGVKPLRNKGLLRWQGEKNSETAVSLPAKRGFWGVIADFTP